MSSTISNSVSALNTNTTPSTTAASGTSTAAGSTSAATSGTAAGALSTYATSNNSGTLSSLGIGSGINANALISQLIAADQAPINAINSDIASYQSQLTSYGQLSAAVYSFQTALGGLTSASSFSPHF